MSNHTIDIPSWLNEGYIEKALQTSLKNDDIHVKSIKFADGSAVGENYACKIFRIHVNYSDQKISNENINIIAKVKPETALVDKFMDGVEIDVFGNEPMFYCKYQPVFEEVLQNISKSVYDITPRCYYSDEKTRSMLLEDLKQRDFVLRPRSESQTLEQLLLAVEALAQFHGAGLLALRKNPDLKEGLSGGFYEGNLKGGIRKFVLSSADQLRNDVDKLGFNDKYVPKMKALKTEIENGSLKFMEKKEGDIHVICHGDAWQNNMMLHFTDGIPDQVILLDFQILNYNCFANDLQYAIFMAGDAEVIVNNIDLLLQKYYNKLVECVPNVPEITFDRIKAQFEARYYFGFVMASCFRPFMLTKAPVDIEDMLDDETSKHDGFSHPKFKADMEVFLPFFEKLGIFDLV